MMITIDTKALNEKWGLKVQAHHSLRFLFIILLLWLFSSAILRGQTPTLPSVATSCDYATAPANMVLTVSNEPAGYAKTYLLVDMATGRIAQVNATAPSFTAVPQGNYYATAAYYNGNLVNAAADSLISKVYTDSLGQAACLIYAPSVALKVCSTLCDFTGTSVAINFTASASPTSGVTTTYVLINEMTNRVLQTNTTASFTNVPVGNYSVSAVYYNGSFGIAVGDTLYNKTTNDTLCVGVSNTIHYNVCTCQAGTTAPIITQTTASNTCPTATVNLSTMTNTGTKPTGTTLIWSTHNTPSVSGDTLTNLAVSTAGKYYALYYDKVNNCYSPADSVTVTITACCANPSVGGTATYTGGTICSTANMGTITLSGQTGDVVKWQTSTNGGTSWTDIANTAYKNSFTFINAVHNQQYRAVVNTGVVSCADANSTVVTIATTGACTTNTCTYTSGTFSPTISTSSNANYTTHVILVNPTDGLIKYVTAANSTAFTGVALGDYIMYAVTYDNTIAPQPTLTAGTNISTLVGCLAVSDALLTKVCCPTIAAPITAVTQPTCSVATGTITIAPISGVTYSFDNGTTYQASNVKSGLTAGATYQVIVKDNTNGCVSTAAPSVINAQPATPTITNVSKTDPSVLSCPSLNDGNITVTATGSNLKYSKDNGTTWQVSNSFTGLLAGSYTIKVKDSVSTCEVAYTSNPVVLTAPTCTVAEICGNLIDDDGDGKIDCEDPDCGPCSCTTISNITYVAPTTNPSANHTRRYVLTNDNGVIQKVSTTPIFLGCPDGQYRVYTVWYIAATYTPPLGMGSNISAVTGTSVVVSLPKLEKVCSPSVQYETRILEKSYNCITKKLVIQVQVRTKPNTGTFLMGDANYRFDYNSTQLTNPVIVSQEHFSNVAPASDVNYVPQSLNGSSEGPTIGTVSLNTVYGGGGLAARTVDSVWQTVSCIQFDKRDTALCYAFRWHDNLENPSTGMSGIVLNSGGAYDVYDVKTGGYYGNYQQCLNTLNCCSTLAIKVILEGPYNATTGLMSTTLNERGLLPGQTPIGQFGVKTPDGQPFNANPWNYTGTETLTNYPTTVVDWVLVSLRTDSLLATSTILRKAGLLHSDGHVSFLDSCWVLADGQKYFAVVEHRNHIGVMSNMAFTAQSNIVLDFTAGDGYIRTNPPTTGQKQVGSKWVMLTGDGRKELQVTNFDINFNDQQRWKTESGIFDQYNYSDFNLDADANFLDSNLWKKNNGRYSGVPH